MTESVVSRRGFLRGAGVALVGGSTASTTARAHHDESQPGSVSISFDREWLETYQPRLDLTAVRKHPDDVLPNGMYAWKATSEDYDTDAAVYWTEYPYQQGISPFGHDSHHGDHEPVYVFVDSETGDIKEVVYSAYHWLRGRTTSPPVAEDTHPDLSAVSPWHQYAVGEFSEGEFIDLDDLGGRFEEWLSDEDFHDALAEGTVHNPWRMAGVGGRQHWWASGRDGISVNAQFVGSMLWISNTVPGVDIGGAGKSDSTE